MKQHPERDRDYLEHVLECIANVEHDVKGNRKRLSNRTIRDAVIRNLQIMAESTTRLSDASKAGSPEIPWIQIAGFRHRLVHDYFDVDMKLVWRVITQHLPKLKKTVRQMLDRLGPA